MGMLLGKSFTSTLKRDHEHHRLFRTRKSQSHLISSVLTGVEARCDDRFCPSKHKSWKNKRKGNSSDFGVWTTRRKTNSAIRLASGKGTRHCSTVLGSSTTGKQDSTQTWTSTAARGSRSYMRVKPKCKSYRHVSPQCKSKNRDNSATFILTCQLITVIKTNGKKAE